MASNRLTLVQVPKDIQRAQEAALIYYRFIANAGFPRVFKDAVSELGKDPIPSLILSGPDSLLKSAIMSAIQAYISLGPALMEKKLSRMNISLPVALLRDRNHNPRWLSQEEVHALEAAGHKYAIIMAKGA